MENNRLADSIETSADELVGELKGVRDSVEELYILLDHIWRNREEIHDILAAIVEKRTEESTEVTCCVHCDASHTSLSDAVKDGWASLQHDPSDGWDYLGICADCQREEAERERRVQQERAELPDGLVVCGTCRAMPLRIAAAKEAGWQDIRMTAEFGGDYVGHCPACVKLNPERPGSAPQDRWDLEADARAMGLTDAQIQQAKEEGVTSALGLRRIEKNSRTDGAPESLASVPCHDDQKELFR